jgi:hypothetical protein
MQSSEDSEFWSQVLKCKNHSGADFVENTEKLKVGPPKLLTASSVPGPN